MAKKTYKALAPFTLNGDIRPGDTFEADPADVVGLDVVELGDVPSGAPTAPTDNADRIAAIVAAIGQLDATNTALFTNAGTPKTDGIAAITGWPVIAKDRDVAWAQINTPQ
jgi:hypothetical protein